MNKITLKKSMIALAVFTVFFVFISQAHAGSVTLSLNRVSLTNVDDAAGRWQHEGGKFSIGGNEFGNYAATRRVTTGGTDAQNTAMLTMTLFINGESPPANITMQGAHDYNNGKYIGSVSAASGDLAPLAGATFSGNTATNTLTITW